MIEVESERDASNKSTIPDPYTEEDYNKLGEFILLLYPLSVLTDAMQKDGIQAPHVLPNILDCYEGKYIRNTLTPYDTFMNRVRYFHRPGTFSNYRSFLVVY